MEDSLLLQFFGKRLRQARHATHLSQKGLAKRLGIGQDTISHYESGRCRPDLTTLARLANVLGVSTGYFFPDDTFNRFDDEHREALARLSSLSPKALEFVLMFVQHYTTCQQRQHFLTGVTARDSTTAILMILERDLRLLEQEVMQRRMSSNASPLEMQVRFTLLLLMVMELENSTTQADDLVQRLAVSGQRLTLLIRSRITTQETAAGA